MAAGLLPLWLAILFVAVDSAGDPYGAGGWVILLALFVCAFTFPVAVVTTGVFLATKGKATRKVTLSASVFAVSCLLLAALFYWSDYMRAQRQEAVDRKIAIEFARSNGELLRASGPRKLIDVSVSTVQTARSIASHPDSDGREFSSRYGIFIRGETDLYAIVVVSRANGEPIATLECVTASREVGNRFLLNLARGCEEGASN